MMTSTGAVDARTSDVARPVADVVAFYSRTARLFEVWGRLVDSRARALVVELCSVTDGDRVLEVGAGSQLVALAAANPSGETVGIDLADGMLREARRM